MKIFLYALSTCYYCRQTKKLFAENGVEFDFVDVDLADEEKKQKLVDEVYALTGEGKFPVIKIDDKVVVGYDEDRLKELLNI